MEFYPCAGCDAEIQDGTYCDECEQPEWDDEYNLFYDLD